ncbi:membrane integrity-associated transporter subunit PqiC [Herbaspirillum sp. LeCh32-8]|uniref:PqiC family protein n=1 Tax=Herbaspirillum sp. LeCh32-8 TaxID=2821356 RepID=UPI001AE14A61|nr:PqiC family protein [Herbaspirillum sp. LeCh32-8]MBP0597788.1 membrane integrity-associated transporter subunit PqiC [Herbaspirillum sp. LeCh32-8]
MMSHHKNNSLKSLAAAALAAAVLAACGSSPPAQFYTLSAPSANVGAVRAQGPQTFIEVMPVAVPDRLARPQLVVRSDAAKLDVLEQERWSSPFNNELRDALASGVAARLGAIDVSRSGRPADQASYRINVELRDMDAVRNDKVQASFGWTVTRSDDRKSAVCRMTVVEPVSGGSAGDVVLAMQKAVGNVADAIAANVRALQTGQGAQCAG